MDKTEAKLILANHTLDTEPSSEARYLEARRLADSDPDLRQWWEQTQDFDKAFQEKLETFAPPEDLRAALVASVENGSKRRVLFKRFRHIISLAACLAIIAFVHFAFIQDNSDSYQGPLVERAFNYSYDGPRLAYFNKEPAKLAEWLGEQDFDLPENLPQNLLQLEGIGCRPLNWSESRVAIICFNAETVFHLFVAKESEFDAFDGREELTYEQRKDGWTVSKWKQSGYAFVLAAQSNQQRLSSLLASYSPREF